MAILWKLQGCSKVFNVITLALSLPLTSKDYEMVRDEAEEIIEKHGLIHFHEQNLDQPEDKRCEWILIARREETISKYRALRDKGFSPVDSLEPFYELLSYDPAEAIHTGYDAFRTCFSDRTE